MIQKIRKSGNVLSNLLDWYDKFDSDKETIESIEEPSEEQGNMSANIRLTIYLKKMVSHEMTLKT